MVPRSRKPPSAATTPLNPISILCPIRSASQPAGSAESSVNTPTMINNFPIISAACSGVTLKENSKKYSAKVCSDVMAARNSKRLTIHQMNDEWSLASLPMVNLAPDQTPITMAMIMAHKPPTPTMMAMADSLPARGQATNPTIPPIKPPPTSPATAPSNMATSIKSTLSIGGQKGVFGFSSSGLSLTEKIVASAVITSAIPVATMAQPTCLPAIRVQWRSLPG